MSNKTLEALYARHLATRGGPVHTQVRGTCQACFGQYALNMSGKLPSVVLHGYERPGCGYIIEECAGVKHPPYELDCEYTKRWRARLVNIEIPAKQKELALLNEGPHRYTIHVHMFSGRKQRPLFIERGKPVTDQEYLRYHGQPTERTWEMWWKSAVSHLKQLIQGLQSAVVELDRRIREWSFRPEALRTRDEIKAEVAQVQRVKREDRLAAREAKLAATNARHLKAYEKAFAEISGLISKIQAALTKRAFVEYLGRTMYEHGYGAASETVMQMITRVLAPRMGTDLLAVIQGKATLDEVFRPLQSMTPYERVSSIGYDRGTIKNVYEVIREYARRGGFKL